MSLCCPKICARNGHIHNMTFDGKIKKRSKIKLCSYHYPSGNTHKPHLKVSPKSQNSCIAPESAVTHPYPPQQRIIHSPTWVRTHSTLCWSSSRDISSSSSSLQSISGCISLLSSPLLSHKDSGRSQPWMEISDGRHQRDQSGSFVLQCGVAEGLLWC